MTREKAIKILKGTLDCDRLLTSGTNEKCVRNQCDDCDLMYAQGTNAEHNEALNMAKRALELLGHLKDRPCSGCEFRKKNGCCKWSCVFEEVRE